MVLIVDLRKNISPKWYSPISHKQTKEAGVV